MSDVVREKPQKVSELVAAVALVVTPSEQTALLWPHTFDSLQHRSLDDVGESGHPAREFYGAMLFEAADNIRARVRLGTLDPKYTAVADRLESLVTQELDVTRASVSTLIIPFADDVLRTAPSLEASVDPLAATVAKEGVALREVVREYPTFLKPVASISEDSATALKKEFKIGPSDLIVGVPSEAAEEFGLAHGDTVRITTDGTTIILGDRQIRLATCTPKGNLTKCMLSFGIRKVTGLKDHRETSTGSAETVPFTVVVIGGERAIWLKVSEKVA